MRSQISRDLAMTSVTALYVEILHYLTSLNYTKIIRKLDLALFSWNTELIRLSLLQGHPWQIQPFHSPIFRRNTQFWNKCIIDKLSH